MDNELTSGLERIRTDLRSARAARVGAPGSLAALLRTLHEDVLAARRDGLSYPQIAATLARHLPSQTSYTRDQLARAVAKFCQNAKRTNPIGRETVGLRQASAKSNETTTVIPLRSRARNTFEIAASKKRVEDNV